MPKGTSNDDQFLFLIACIRHSNNGKINFDEVAKDCDIVTKGAAAKRYERLMKSHGIHQPTGPVGRDTGVQPLKSKGKRKAVDVQPVAKKRKHGEIKEEPSSPATESDDEETSVEAALKIENQDDFEPEHFDDILSAGDNTADGFANADDDTAETTWV